MGLRTLQSQYHVQEEEIETMRENLKNASNLYRPSVRVANARSNEKRDNFLHYDLTEDMNKMFNALKNSKSTATPVLDTSNVGGNT